MIETLHDKFYLQAVKVSDQFSQKPRLEVFRHFCDGKAVLHIGCVQYPLTNPQTSIHVDLAPFCRRLDGYDLHTEAYDLLRPFVKNGDFLESLDGLASYDVVLIPEVLEHVGNVGGFLDEMSRIKTERIILTVPDLFQCFSRNFERIGGQDTFLEAVNPDHNCWYSPYTIANTIRKYTRWKIMGIYWFNRISLLVDCMPQGPTSLCDLGTEVISKALVDEITNRAADKRTGSDSMPRRFLKRMIRSPVVQTFRKGKP